MPQNPELLNFQKDARFRDFLLIVVLCIIGVGSLIRIEYDFDVVTQERTKAMNSLRESHLYTWDLLRSLGAKTNLKEPEPYGKEDNVSK